MHAPFPRVVLAVVSVLLSSPGCRSAAADRGAVALETRALRFRLSPQDGRFEITAGQSKVVWRSNPYLARFGEVVLGRAGQPERRDLGPCEVVRQGRTLLATFRPVAGHPEATLRVTIRALDDPRTLEFGYDASDALAVESVRLLDEALWTADADGGYAVVPVREGLLVPADSGLAFTNRFDTYAYEGCHLAMFGVVKGGMAALVTWRDPYTALELRSVLTHLDSVRGSQVLSPSLVLRKSARSFQVRFLGPGDYNTIAQAYRGVAKERGWLVRWERKLAGHPERARLFGAINYKLWSTLDRRMNLESTKEESVRVNWTFDEAAQVAEHLKQDLKLEKVLFTVGGWIHRGYDNQHPDILPAAPECGGDPALADCARRVQRLGYPFCLHDNYQDMYRDAPSWNEEFLMKNPDGSLTKGGHWAGGLAYLTCSRKAVELAQRPQNLPAVRRLTGAQAYFIDTTYAAGLQECFDKTHPLTRGDDLKWKQAISDYARDVFGIFGSECGREWAIPHSDFFEGLSGVSGTYYHDAGLVKRLGATVVPFFELVYRDCIAIYGKYGYNPAKAVEYVLHHVSLGRTLNYHNVPAHLYWKRLPAESGDPGVFVRADGGWAAGLHPYDRFVKNTYEILSPLNELTSRTPMTRHEFLTADRAVRRSLFGEGNTAVRVTVNGGTNEWRCATALGGEVRLPQFGFVVESPAFVAFHATRWGGVEYPSGALFTLRSQDGKPLARSRQVRVYHGFGGTGLRLGSRVVEVEKEAVLGYAH